MHRDKRLIMYEDERVPFYARNQYSKRVDKKGVQIGHSFLTETKCQTQVTSDEDSGISDSDYFHLVISEILEALPLANEQSVNEFDKMVDEVGSLFGSEKEKPEETFKISECDHKIAFSTCALRKYFDFKTYRLITPTTTISDHDPYYQFAENYLKSEVKSETDSGSSRKRSHDDENSNCSKKSKPCHVADPNKGYSTRSSNMMKIFGEDQLKKQRSDDCNIDLMSMQKTICILYLALRLINEDIFASDLINWAVQGEPMSCNYNTKLIHVYHSRPSTLF